MIRSLRTRLALVSTIVLTTVLVITSFVLYRMFVTTHQREFDAALHNYAIDLAGNMNVSALGDLSFDSDIVYEENKVFPFSLGKVLIQITTDRGSVVTRSRDLGKVKLPFHTSLQPVFTDMEIIHGENNVPYRVVSLTIFKPTPTRLYLQVAVPKTFLLAERKNLLEFFAVVIPLAILLSGLGGYFLAKKALEPVNSMTEAARKIQPNNLSARVPLPKEKDEVYRLAETINSLLARLEQAFASLDRFIADASHQLKTPLAILKGELEMLGRDGTDAKRLREFLESSNQEITTLSKAVENLLLLAKVDAGLGALVLQDTRIDDLLIREVGRLEKKAKTMGIRLVFQFENLPSGMDLEQAFSLRGDPDLLKEMLSNLLDNAIKYSPPGGSVHISLGADSSGVRVRIKDEGPGIQPLERERIFERFVQGKQAKEGTGLGLAIAKKIADLHDGELQIEDKPLPGATFIATLPHLKDI